MWSFLFLEACPVRTIRVLAPILLFTLFFAAYAAGQDTGPRTPIVAAPNLMVLVHQEIQFGKGSARQRLEAAAARAADRFSVPYSWFDLQSLTGPREALTLSPFDSFDHLEQAFVGWNQIYAAHADLARLRDQMDELVAGEDAVIAIRRNDLGYRVSDIDLASARFLRVIEVHVLPGHEGDFTEGAKILSDAYEKARVDTPWAVYQVKMGMQSSNFIILMPMTFLKQNDDLILSEEDMQNAEGEEGEKLMQQIVREGYAGTTNNLYAISFETSHLAKELTPADSASGTSTAPDPSKNTATGESSMPSMVPDPAADSTPKTSGKN
jgi:hypothetical protein